MPDVRKGIEYIVARRNHVRLLGASCATTVLERPSRAAQALPCAHAACWRHFACTLQAHRYRAKPNMEKHSRDRSCLSGKACALRQDSERECGEFGLGWHVMHDAAHTGGEGSALFQGLVQLVLQPERVLGVAEVEQRRVHLDRVQQKRLRIYDHRHNPLAQYRASRSSTSSMRVGWYRVAL
eukprot:3933446-Rhodomonas_salina.5